MVSDDNTTQIQQLLDREAIRELVKRYGHYVWQGNVDGFLSLYAEDGVFRSADPDWPAARGHIELRRLLEGMLGQEKPRAFMHNHVVDLVGPREATGTVYTEVRLSIRGEKGLLVGFYDDQYAKIDGLWKFKERKITVEYYGPMDDYKVPSEGANASYFE